MQNNSRQRRRSIRLKNYDYSQPGAYFVTICTQNRKCLFGEVVEGQTVLNEVGLMVKAVLEELAPRYPNIELNASVIMPNHVHAVIVLLGVASATGLRTDPSVGGPGEYPEFGQPQGLPLHYRFPRLCIGSKALPQSDTQTVFGNLLGSLCRVDCGSAIISNM
jgi:hypothetical protein